MKKISLTALWVMLLTALTTVTVYADLIIPGKPRQPSPTPPALPEPVNPPEPAPVPAQPDTALITALIAGVAVMAAAVIAWIVVRRRRNRSK